MLETLMMILLFVSGNGTDLLSTVDTDAYWKSNDTLVSTDQLLHDAQLPSAPAPDISIQLKNLGDPDFSKRQAAKKAILAIGPSAIAPLTAALKDKDPEVATAARDILAQLQLKSKARDIRQLMAIRTLGERKTLQAAPLLQTLATSTSPFVADYAKHALALINNTPENLTPHTPNNDASLMPDGTAIIAQQSAGMARGITLSALVDLYTPNPEGPDGTTQKNTLKDNANKSAIALLEKIGNVRIDSVTFAASAQMNDDHAFAVLIIRGKWNKKTVAESLRDTFDSQGDAGSMEDGPIPGGGPQGNAGPILPHAVPVVVVIPAPDATTAPAPHHDHAALDLQNPILLKGPDTAAIVVSDEQLILITGTDEDRTKVISQMTDALKTGKGGITRDKQMSALLATADTTQPVWGILNVSSDYAKNITLVAPFKTATLSGTLRGTNLDLTLTATPADSAKPAAEKISTSITDMIKDLAVADTPEMEPTGKTLIALLKKIHITSNKSTTLTLSLTPAEVLTLMRQLPMGDILDTLAIPMEDENGQDPAPKQN